MVRSLFIAALAVAAAGFGLSTGARADIDPTRVHIIDHRLKTKRGGEALIFRGNTPVNDAGTALNYTAWYGALANAAKEQVGVTLASPNKVYIIDICFQNAVMDYQFAAEEAFWKDPANAAKGEFVHWILLGSLNYPPDFTPAQQEAMARNTSLWDIDQMPPRIQKMRQMMLDGPPPGYSQVAIYFHCTHGQDRTGLFANAYRLSYHESITDGGRLAGYNPSTEAMAMMREASAKASLSSDAATPERYHSQEGSAAALVPPPLLKMAGEQRQQQLVRLGAGKGGASSSSSDVVVAAAAGPDMSTLSKIYAMGCEEGRRCPMYSMTANIGWYCLWSNAFNGTAYDDCATSYKCHLWLFCDSTA